YYLTGAISAGNNVTITGTGVTIYLAPGSPGGSVTIDANGDSLNLKAPTTGTYKGIVIYQDRANANAANLGKNNGTFTWEGALYPAMALTTAARAGAQYGAASLGRSADAPGMQSAAAAAAPNVSGVVTNASRTCQCVPDNGATFTTASCTSTCPSGQHLAIFV